jgi:outer membrane protein assembly factor BamB
MKSRSVVFGVLAAALLLSTGAGCGRKLYPPEFLSLPDTAYANVHALCRLVATGQSYDSARYIVDWGDGLDTTDASFRPADTAYVGHMWMDTGQYEVRTRTLTAGARHRLSAWSAPETVQVVPSLIEHAPVIDSVDGGPPVGVRNVETFFTVYAHDPDGDAVRVKFDWGDSDTTTGYFSSPCSITVGHVFTQIGTAMVIITAQDTWGATSFPETVLVSVGYAGGVIWFRSGRCWTSALVASDGSEECVYCSVEEYPGDAPLFRAIDAAGHVKHTFEGTAALIDEPACCAATGHIIVGGDGGEFYALGMDLSGAWDWMQTWWRRWGPMAINGARIYLKTDYDSIYYFIDSISSGARVAAFDPSGYVTDAPVVDAQGNVYFDTDSGYLYKMGPELDTVFWRTRLLANGEIHSPVIGGDGTVYCASESSRLYAIDPTTGIPSWTVTLDGDVFRPALGQAAIFVGTSFGKAYSINPTTGAINWQKTLKTPYGPDEQFSTTPIVTANGYVYFQSENDVLYCLNQADGTVIWYCDCPLYLPRSGGNSHRPRRTQLTDYLPNPTILSNGNIIVPGAEALYCVAGYPERPLDPFAPWPKWQHDLYNTGYVGGGK